MNLIVYPALNGDCILMQTDGGNNILVDGGYVETYKHFLRPKLCEIQHMGENIDLVITTHIDRDHISGIISMLEDELLVPIREIWYNGYRHAQRKMHTSNIKETIIHRPIISDSISNETIPVGAVQGCTLSALIQRRGLAWNLAFEGKAIIGRKKCIPLGYDRIYVLTPNEDNLNKLQKYWEKELLKRNLLSAEHREEFWDDAYEFELAKDTPGFHFKNVPISSNLKIEELKKNMYIPDDSKTNGSSISFVLESGKRRILMMSDAHAEDILNALRVIYPKEKTIHFDAIKMSHHGSFSNNSPELLGMIDSNKWIISTNGDLYGHPDLETLVHIISKDKVNRRVIYCNYFTDAIDKLKNENWHQQYKYDVVVATEQKPLVIDI